MASHQIAIAKASFAAGLLRPDPVSVSRDEIARIHSLLDQVVTQCSPSNIQSCKIWLLDNVVPSPGRIAAFAKYLAALSASFGAVDVIPDLSNGTKAPKAVSTKRKRLHLLYLVNDLLHHTKYHTEGATSRHASFASNIQPHLVNLFNSSASFDSTKHAKHHAKLFELLDLWEKNVFHGAQFIESLRQTVRTAGASGDVETTTSLETNHANGDVEITRSGKDVPFIMPASHGDLSTPYYDLPAGNLMPHIIPNSTMPINPELVKPLQFVAGPAEESLATVVKDFLNDVENMYNSRSVDDEGVVVDIDELGQPLVKDEDTGELVAKEGYYGWSVAFCERMKKRKRGGPPSESNGRGGGRSRSRSSSRSSGPRKRRRSISSASERSHRDRDRRRPRSESRSRSRNGRRDSRDSPYRSRSRQARSRSPVQEAAPRSATHPSLTALQVPSSRPASNQPFVTPADQIDNPFTTKMPPAPTAPNAQAFQHNFPVGPGGLPVPPPPPFHQGPWPPPPPALPAGASYSPGQYPNFSTTNFPPGNFVPPPPPGWLNQQQPHGSPFGQSTPPPPPPPALGPGWHENQDQGYGRGRGRNYGQNQWNGRGGSNNWNRGQDQRRW